MKKVRLSIIGGVIASLIIANSVCAVTANQDVVDKVNTTQGITEQSSEEIEAAAQKSKDAEILINSIESYKSNEKTISDVDKAIKDFNEKYDTKITSDKISGLGSTSKTSTNSLSGTSVASVTDSSTLGYSCVKQLQDWYCGPASAYIIIGGMGNVSSKTLSQANLATDLGATTSGASFPGTWTNTLNSWTGKYYVANWGPSASSLLANAYVDTMADTGTIYDTYMSGSNQLYGYAVGSTRYHYVAGDGYDNTNSKVHYLDPHNTNNTAYGSHWATSTLMASCISARGMVW